MNVEAYILNWNEKDILPLTIIHYRRFCTRIVIYDNYSDDGSDTMAEQMGCEVRKFGTPGELNDGDYIKVKNNCWKESKADWVIVCDADEILLPPNRTYDPCTIYKTQGYNMFSNSIPKKKWTELKQGVLDNNYSKLVAFNPSAIQEINYVYGCHEANPIGDIRFSEEVLKLLHYKHVGGANRIADRHALYAKRMSELNKRWKLGFQYQEPRQKTIDYFNENLSKSINLW